MKTYTCGQIQIVRDALTLAQDISEGEINRKIRGAIDLLDMPLDAFEEVYRLKDEVKRLTAERDEVREALRIMLLQSPYQDGDGGHRYQACRMAQDALDHVPNVGKMVGQGEKK